MKSFALMGFIMMWAPLNAQQDADALFAQAHIALDSQQYALADKLFTTGLQVKPGNYEAYFYRGLSRANLHNQSGALTDYSIFLEFNPHHAEALFQRAYLHYALEHYQQACDDFIRLLTIPKGETSTVVFRMPRFGKGVDKLFTSQNDQRDYIFNYIGLSFSKLKQFDRAIVYFDSAIALSPSNADYYIHRGLAFEGMSALKSAFENYQHALAMDSTNGLALHNLAVLAQKQNKGSFNEEYYTRAIDAAPHLPYAYAERAYYRLQQKKYKGAIEDYTEALKRDQRDPDLWLNRGIAKDKLGDAKGAIPDFNTAIALQEDFSMAYLNRGNAYIKLKSYDLAIEDFSIAILYNQAYGLAYYNRAIAHHAIKNDKLACRDLLQAEALGLSVKKEMKQQLCLIKN